MKRGRMNVDEEILERYLKALTEESQEDRWITLVLEIVNVFGERTVDPIVRAIRNDTLVETAPGKLSTTNSRKWNTMSLAYAQNNFVKSALLFLEELIKREPENSATQNNFGVVLLKAGRHGEAKHFFERAYESDKKGGIDQAQKLPAYLNLRLIEQENIITISKSEKIRGVAPSRASQHIILFMDIVGFSRREWYGTIQVKMITFLVETVHTILEQLGYEPKEVSMLHTGDGMALFLDKVEDTIKLAIQLTKSIDAYNIEGTYKLEIRIGIHNGFSFPVNDLHGGGNRCGPAINTARRVLDLGEARHILCTSDFKKHLVELYGPKYAGMTIHGCGTYVVKHGETIDLYNICGEHFGNQECPSKDS